MRSAEPGDSAGPVVSRRSLVVRRGGRLVLDDLTFGLAPGKVTGLLGPSGCGKTTLMRVLVGVQAITAGTVTVLGLPAGHPRLRARVGPAGGTTVSPEMPLPRAFSPLLAGATAGRVLTQLRHDPRTIAMMVAVPTVLMILLRYVVANPLLLNRVAPEYIGVFPFVIMFIVAAITTQRERARGTLERLMAMPLGKLDLLAGYGIAFGLVACVQVTLVLPRGRARSARTSRSSWRSPSPP